MAKQIIKGGKLAKPTLGQEIKNNFKQGMGDAVDTLTRLPNRVAGLLGNKQAYTKINPKNKGEVAAKELVGRTKNAIKAFKK